jgi:hypothetical protein
MLQAGTREEALMDVMNGRQLEREEQRAQASRGELVERIARAIHDDGTATPLEGLMLRRASSPMELGHSVSYPSLCVIAQGSKELRLGDRRYRYDPAHYLITTAALPIASRVVEASPEHPYLGLVLRLDPTLVGSVLVEAGHLAPQCHAAVQAINVNTLDADLLDAVVRLVRLVDSPPNARFLMPLIMREIVYRLLIGEQGGRLRQLADLGGHAHRIAQAIERLRKDFDRPLRIEDVARESGMSVSGFHHPTTTSRR